MKMDLNMHHQLHRLSRFMLRIGAAGSALATIGVLILLPGCSGGGLEGVYPVHGKVTYKGEPVGGAMISFVGDNDARPATAVSKSDGTFELMTQGSPGAFPGTYKVVVVKTEAGSAAADPGFSPEGQDLSMEQAAVAARKPIQNAKELLPPKYSSPQSTPLTCEVKSTGENVCDLKLE